MLMPSEDDFTVREPLQSAAGDTGSEPPPARDRFAHAVAYVFLVPLGLIAGALGGLVFALFTGILEFSC